MHKAGFVSIIGKPNVGKSSLMNALIGEKLSAVTQKAQTTRHRIFGILNDENYQLVISDTPGLIKPAYLMHEAMMKFVNESITDADVFLIMTDVIDKFDFDDVIIKIRKMGIPVIVAINKCDLSEQDKVKTLITFWQEKIPEAQIIPISVLAKFNLDLLLQILLEHIPVHPPFFSKEEISNMPVRFFTSEIIREQIFLNYKDEIPYSVEIMIESFVETDKLVKIGALLCVIRDSQKGILIGKNGTALKRVGTEARKGLEKFLDKKVFLEIHVKVQKDWREDKAILKNFGFAP
ncbi:MAG: GTPase Era [Bacteroidales bacterium]|nr:GTPase Era [Bacteroidales bacterium]